jgi:hypothetical protein
LGNSCEGGRQFQVGLAVVAKNDSSNISQGGQVARLTDAVRDTRSITPRRKDGIIGDKEVAMGSIKGEKKVRSCIQYFPLFFDKMQTFRFYLYKTSEPKRWKKFALRPCTSITSSFVSVIFHQNEGLLCRYNMIDNVPGGKRIVFLSNRQVHA